MPTLKALLEVNPELIHVKNLAGQTPLHTAAKSANGDGVRALLKKGADPMLRDNGGRTALHCAACHNNMDAVEDLLFYGTDPNAKDNYGRKAIDVARKRLGASPGHAGIIKLIDRIVNLNP